MEKRVRVHDRDIKMYSTDGGRSWSSCRKALHSFDQRRKLALATRLTPREIEWINNIGQPEDLLEVHTVRPTSKALSSDLLFPWQPG